MHGGDGDVEAAGKVTKTGKWGHQMGRGVVHAANCGVLWRMVAHSGGLHDGNTDSEGEEEGESSAGFHVTLKKSFSYLVRNSPRGDDLT
jgi:hypothetical protein